MVQGEDRLARIERQIREGEERVARLAPVVRRLEAGGHRQVAAEARRVLANLEASLVAWRHHRRTRRARLEQGANDT